MRCPAARQDSGYVDNLRRLPVVDLKTFARPGKIDTTALYIHTDNQELCDQVDTLRAIVAVCRRPTRTPLKSLRKMSPRWRFKKAGRVIRAATTVIRTENPATLHVGIVSRAGAPSDSIAGPAGPT